ncbi:MAG: diguanylate cyclase, partial [Desulfobacterales bacterium]|nr:diguanylate cyclase [Desulfobacterales bacterium]
ASIGISIYPLDGWDLDTILKLADDAMYQAKQQGGGRCVVQGTW